MRGGGQLAAHILGSWEDREGVLGGGGSHGGITCIEGQVGIGRAGLVASIAGSASIVTGCMRGKGCSGCIVGRVLDDEMPGCCCTYSIVRIPATRSLECKF